MYSIDEIAEIKAHEWGFPFDHALRERIKKLVIPYLATIIQRRYDQTGKYPTSLILTLDCIELIRDDCYGLNGVNLKRTKDKIPAPLTTRNQSDFNYVGEKNYSKSFSRIRPESLSLQKHKMFSSKYPYYFYDKNYIYFGNVNNLQYATISYVPENPLEVLKLQGEEDSCFGESNIGVVQGSLLDGVLSLIEKNRPKVITPDLDAEVNIKE